MGWQACVTRTLYNYQLYHRIMSGMSHGRSMQSSNDSDLRFAGHKINSLGRPYPPHHYNGHESVKPERLIHPTFQGGTLLMVNFGYHCPTSREGEGPSGHTTYR